MGKYMKSSIARIREHPAVLSVNDYRFFSSSGLFVSLKPGWVDPITGHHFIYDAGSSRAINLALRSLSPCHCPKCTAHNL